MRRLFSGVALLLMVWVVPASFADKAPPPPTNPTPKPKPEPAPAPRPEPEAKPPAKNCDLTLGEFMEAKIKGTTKDKALTKEEVDAKLAVYYKDLLSMVPDPKWNEGATSWKKLVEKTIDKKTWGTSCKTCHNSFESKYAKAHHDKKICFTVLP